MTNRGVLRWFRLRGLSTRVIVFYDEKLEEWIRHFKNEIGNGVDFHAFIF